MRKKQKILFSVFVGLLVATVAAISVWGIFLQKTDGNSLPLTSVSSNADTSMAAILENENDTDLVYGFYANVSLDEVLRTSCLIVKGSYVGPQETSTHTDHVFTNLEILRGEYSEPTLSVCDYPELPLEGCQYKSGKEYLLVLGKTVSVYLEHDEYYPQENLHIPLEPSATMLMQGRPLGRDVEEQEFMEDPIQFLSKFPIPEADLEEYVDGTPYMFSNSWEEIIPQCGYVLKLDIGASVTKNEKYGTEAYDCSVQEVYKGGEVDSEIILNFFEGMVEQGKEYIALLEKVGDGNSLVYALAAKEDVVFPADSAEAQEIIQAMEDGGETE